MCGSKRPVGQAIYQAINLIISLTILCGAKSAVAELISPITISNYNPLVAIHGLPSVGEAEVLGRGAASARLTYDLSSHYAVDETDSESILLDGETSRAAFIYRRGIVNDFELALTIPYIQHQAGGLDAFINDWHAAFGMPQGGRDLAQNNQFRYVYTRDSQTRFDRQNSSSGMGDISMRGTWQLQRSAALASALSLSVKLPTGNSDDLHGSGAVDAAVWYKNEAVQQFFGLRGGSFYSLGALYCGEGQVLPDLLRQLVGFGGVGAGIYFTDKLLFISQLDINTPFYSSDLVELGSFAVQLTLGGSILLSEHGRINLGLGEDLVIDASPDVTFHLDGQWRF